MKTYRVREVSEQGRGRCHDCMQLSMRVIAKDRLLLADWDQRASVWREHECKKKAVR